MMGKISVQSIVSLLIAVCLLTLFANPVSAQPAISVEEDVDTDITADNVRGSGYIDFYGYELLGEDSTLKELTPEHYGEEIGLNGRAMVEGVRDEGVLITYDAWATDEPTHAVPENFVWPEGEIMASTDGTIIIEFDAIVKQGENREELQIVCEIGADTPNPPEACLYFR